jgi:tetratricopeptide (TPR) repeat protein
MRGGSLALPVLFLAVASAFCGRSHQDSGSAGEKPPAASTPLGPDAPLVLPGAAANYVNLGVAEYRQGRYHEASAAFEKARDLVPADLRVSTLLGTSLLQAKRYTPAQDEFRRILTIHPEAVEARLGLARIGIRLGDFESATTQFREALQRDPKNLQALYNLGLLRYRAGDYSESIALLGSVVALKPDLPDAHYTLGLAYARQSQDSKAEAEFRKTIELAPQNSQAHFNLAKIYLRAGKSEEAAREQALFTKLWDRQAADRAAEGNARARYLAGDYAGALKEFDRLAQIDPLSGRFQLGRGLCFLKMGQKNDALSAFQKAAELDPKLPDAHYHLAVLYQERGEVEKSEQERRAFEALETIGENKTGF